MNMQKQPLMATRVNSLTLAETTEAIGQFIDERRKAYVVEVNVDVMIKIEKDEELRRITEDADLVLVDGQPLVWVAKLYRRPVKEKVSGSDLSIELCRMAAEKGYTMFILGGKEGVADQAKAKMEAQYPGLQVVGTCAPPLGFEKDEAELAKVREAISAVSPDIVLCCLGCPKQEKWIDANHRDIDARVFLCAGATVDFLAGNVRRAPAWVSRIGMEWFYRFLMEPRRLFKRYFIDDMHLFRLIFKYRHQRAGKTEVSA